MRVGLVPTCAGCHMAGERGYFASPAAFEALLVGDPRLVRAGDPEASELVLLLEGRRTGASYAQMPISGDSFSALAERGETGISMEEIRDWIAGLEVPALSTRPETLATTIRRIDATQIELGLTELLGLTDEDFFITQSEYAHPWYQPRSAELYAVRGSRDREILRGENYWSPLGEYDTAVSTSFVQALVPISQQWCAMAIRKPGNTALFRTATVETGTAEMEALRAELAVWHLRFLSDPASEAEVDAVISSVFAPLEAESGTTVAWTGTCSFFVRHPRFVFY